jgi:hypothetical protein
LIEFRSDLVQNRLMAKAKKKAKKAAPKKKASAAKKRSVARSRPKAAGLTDEQRSQLLKPPAAYDDAITSLVDAWSANKSVRLDGLSPAKLGSMLKRAQRAWEREDEQRRKLEAKLRELTDARMLAENAAWRGALDVWDMAKSVGRRRPEVREAFDFMSNYVGGGSRPREEPEPEEPSGG